MSSPHSPANTAGFVAFLVGTIATGVSSVASKALAQTPDASITASHGIWATIALGVIGLLTQVVTGINSNAKLRKEVTDKLARAEQQAADAKAEAERAVADAKAEAARAVADAKAEAARLIADAKAESDRRHAKADMEAEQQAARRKSEREFQNAELLRMETTIRDMERERARLVPKVERNTEAIDAIAAGTRIAVSPPPETP